jgi:LmbE family N-acetylglucosaminyl deacetylase
MKLKNKTAEIYVPDGTSLPKALARTTHLAVTAHQDDIEIMAPHGVLKCYQQSDLWFTGITVTDGSGSPRSAYYKDKSDEQMCLLRREEQKRASHIGEYGSVIFLDYSSQMLKSGFNKDLVHDLVQLFTITQPKIVYTHNPADKHDSHVSIMLHTIEALRSLQTEKQVKAVYGCEVWRDLDWMIDQDKIVEGVSERENLQMALLGVFDSQISGGKRYDLAALGRRRANATFYESHATDKRTGLVFSMDLSPLVADLKVSIEKYVTNYIERFHNDVADRLRRLSYGSHL